MRKRCSADVRGIQNVSWRVVKILRGFARLIRACLDWLLLEGSQTQAGSAFENYLQQMEEEGLRTINADEVWQDLDLDSPEQRKA